MSARTFEESNMGVIWYKIWFDIWHNKTRTFLAVLSIAAGVFAVGAIFGMSDMLLTNMDKSHHAVLATHVNVALASLVDRDTILSLQECTGRGRRGTLQLGEHPVQAASRG